MKVSLNWLKDYVDIDCSVAELGDRLTNIGLNLEEVIERANDTVLDLEVTSNRPDCLGHIGVAREIAAAMATALRLPAINLVESDTRVEDLTSVEVARADLCPRYTARVIQSATIARSPDWLVNRLEAVGVRSINNVVDITNYLLLESGQPLHAFDYDKLAEHRIIVRPARYGETIVAIDHTRHELNDQNLVIADAEKAVAVAGVMGGLATEVSERTTTVLLESARFEPLSIRRTARQLNLHSESSYRFERAVDPVNVEWASRRAAGLICGLTAGSAARGVVDAWTEPFRPRRIDLSMALVRRILGIDVPRETAEDILRRLGFQPSRRGETLTVTVPAHRADVTRPIDLVEEIGRLWGYDKIPTRQTVRIAPTRQTVREKITTTVSDALNECGFSEAMTVSLVEAKTAGLFADINPQTMLRASDQVGRADNVLRCSLLPSLLAAATLNQNAGNGRCELYELARVYLPRQDELPEEKLRLGMVSTRRLRALQGAIEHVLDRLRWSDQVRFEQYEYKRFLPDQSATVMLGDRELGMAGTIDPSTQTQFNLRAPLAVAELDFDLLIELPRDPVRSRPLPRYPAIQRDLSIIIDEDIPWRTIETTIRQSGIPQLQAVEFGEMFHGKQIPAGRKSIFLTMTFRHPEHSLTHDQVDRYQDTIIDALRNKCGAVLRTGSA